MCFGTGPDKAAWASKGQNSLYSIKSINLFTIVMALPRDFEA
jgi:hypothetical protein